MMYKEVGGWKDVMYVSPKQTKTDRTSHPGLLWTVSVNLKQICITETTKPVTIPDTVVTLLTNVKEIKLSDTLVHEMLVFQLNTTLSVKGDKITLIPQ